jgi:hypothetical protein
MGDDETVGVVGLVGLVGEEQPENSKKTARKKSPYQKEAHTLGCAFSIHSSLK